MRSRLVLLSLGVLLAVLLVQAEQADGDELVIRRVQVPPDRLAAELERARLGVLVSVPRRDFEEKVRQYRESRNGSSSPARLVSARYHKIRLQENADRLTEPFLTGSAEWTVLSPGREPSLLPLQPLSLALGKVRFENRNALVGDFDGEQPCLVVDQPGKQTVLLDWTARGEHAPEGILFDLRVPPTPLAQLEIELPVGRQLTVSPEGCLVEEDKSELPNHRLWKVRFSGRSSLFLTVGHPARPGAEQPTEAGGPVLLERVRSVHHLGPEGESSEFVFDVRVNARGLNRLVFTCDAPLKPYQVGLGSADLSRLDRWEFQEGALGRGRSALVLQFNEPLSGTVQPRLYFRAPFELPRTEGRPRSLPDALAWQCPRVSLQPEAIVPRNETIELRVSSQVRLEQWNPGDFRLAGVESAGDRSRSLQLTGTGLVTGATRPRARIRLRGADYLARVHSWWQENAGVSRLEVQIAFEIRHGSIFEVPLWIAPGWQIETVNLSGSGETLRSWSAVPAPAGLVPGRSGGELLTAELRAPLEPLPNTEKLPLLLLRLREREPRQGGRALPVVLPVEATSVEGGLAIDWDEEVHEGTVRVVPPGEGVPQPREVVLPSDELPEGSPWGNRLPRYYLNWRGQPPRGSLQLRPRPIRFHARSQNRVTLIPQGAQVSSRLTLEVLSGAVDAIDFQLSAPLPGGVSPLLKVESKKDAEEIRVEAVEPRLEPDARGVASLVGTRSVAGLACLTRLGPGAQPWKAILSRPVRPGESLSLGWETVFRLTDEAAGSQHIPLLTFSRGGTGEVSVQREGLLVDRIVQVTRMNEAPAESRAGVRVYRHHSGPVQLSVRAAPTAENGDRPVPGARAVLTRAELLTRIDPEGPPVSLYRFEVRDWAQATLPLRLPAGARLVGVRVDGREATVAAPGPGAGETENLVELPVPQTQSRIGSAAGEHHFEILYISDASCGGLAVRMESPVPVTPLEPLALRRIWRLPAGLVPLNSAGLSRIPGTAQAGGLSSWSLQDRLPAWASVLQQRLTLDPWALRQEQALRSADHRLRRASGGQTRALGEVLRQLASGGLAEQRIPLVIDAAALADAGLTPTHQLSVPVWREEEGSESSAGALAELDLVHVHCKSGVLVTTRRESQAWQRGPLRHDQGEAPPAVLRAVADAAEQGQDPTGRFRGVAGWLESPWAPEGAARAWSGMALQSLPPADDLVGWSDWLATPGAGSVLWVVPTRVPIGGGLGLAALFLLAMLATRKQCGTSRDNRLVLLVLLLWLGMTGLGVLWLPAGLRDLAWWPLAAGVVAALWWYLVPPRQPERGQGGRASTASRKALQGGLTTGMLLLVWASGAAEPAPADTTDTTVYMVSGKTADEDAVLVPPALLRKLERRPDSRALAEAVLVGADYRVTATQGSEDVHVEAVLDIWCSGAGPATLRLPFEGIRLDREPLLDGARTPLEALPRSGFSLRVGGAGAHKLQLTFLASRSPNGTPSDVQFSVPRVAQSRLSLRVPGKGNLLQSLIHLGSQKASVEEQGSLLEVELGAVPSPGPRKGDSLPIMPVQLRWSESKPERAPLVQVREAYLWDLGQRGHTLTGVILFDIGPGVADRLVVDIPAELTVSRLEVSRSRREGGETVSEPGPVRLRDWKLAPVKGKPSPLVIELQTPVSGRVQVILSGHPQASAFSAGRVGPRSATLVLPVPRPHGRSVSEGGFLGYRLSGLRAEHGQTLRLVGFEGKFPDFFWQAVSGREAAPSYVARILRQGEQGPILPLTLQVEEPRRTGTLQLVWNVGPTLAELHGTLDLQGTDLVLAEWEVPSGVAVSGVSGADVREWTLLPLPGGAQRVQVWLQRPVRRTQIELRGSAGVHRLGLPERRWSGVGGALGAVLQRNAPQLGVFPLPVVKVPGLDRPATTVQVQADSGLTLTPQALRQLNPSETEGTRPRWLFSVRREDYGGGFLVSPARQPSVRLITFVELTDREVMIRARLEPVSAQEDLTHLRWQVQGWTGIPFKVEAAGARTRALARGQGGNATRIWEVRYEQPERRGLSLTARAPLEAVRGLTSAGIRGLLLPQVDVSGAACVERWLVLDPLASRLRLQAEEPARLASGTISHPEVEKLRRGGGTVWRQSRAGPGLWLLEQSGSRPAVKVAPGEHVAAVLDERHWTYRSTWWLFHDGPVEIPVQLPAGARAISLMVDDRDQPLSSNRDPVLSLQGAGVRRVTLRWGLAEEANLLLEPSLNPPRLQGELGTGLRTVHVPPGYRVSMLEGFRGGVTAAAELELERAASQVQMAGLLLEALGRGQPRAEAMVLEAQLTACQQRLARHLWHAGQSALNDERGALADRGQAIREQVRELFRRYGREPARVDPGEAASIEEADDLSRSGHPLYQTDTRAGGSIQLVSEANQEIRQALAGTGLLVCLLLGVWVLSSFDLVTRLAHLFWPEQAVILGLLGLQFLGPSWGVIFLLVLGGASRLLWLVWALVSFLHRAAPSPVRRGAG